MAAELEINFPRKGIYVQITPPTGEAITLPYSAPSIGHDISHILSQPVPEIVDWIASSAKHLGQAIGGWAKLFAMGAQGTAELLDILGVKLFNRLYFGSSWKGTQPSEFSLTLDLKTGWKNEYKGSSEVVKPLRDLYILIAPNTSNRSGAGLLISPGPTPYNVITEFVKGYWSGITMEAITRTLTEQNAGELTSTASSVSGTGTRKGKWSLAFAYFNGNNPSKIFFKIDKLVASSGNLKLDTSLMDSEGNPCAGVLTVAFKSANITVDADIMNMFPLAAGA